MNIRRLAGLAVSIIIIVILFVIASCSSTNNQYSQYTQSLGSCKKSQEVSKLFNTYQYQPNYKYYFAGFMKDPEAIVGFHNEYLIEKSCGRGVRAVRWHEIDTTPQNLGLLVKGIALKGNPYGADILDHAGKQLGILYTYEQFEYEPFVRESEDNSICVVPQYYVGIDWRKGN